MAELDGFRVAAVLAADANVQVFPHVASQLHGQFDQASDAFRVQSLERVFRQIFLFLNAGL